MPLPRILKFLPVFWRLIGVAAPIALGIAIGQWISPWLPTFSKYLATLGWWAPLAFVAAYVVVVVLMLPAFLMIMASGAVFGTVEGTFLSMVGALTGGTCAFLIARHGARDFVVRKLSGHPTLSAIDSSIGEHGGKIIFLLRLSPAVPFVLSNYALGITRVRLSHFLGGTLGFIPVVFAYAVFGHASTGPVNGATPLSPLVLGVGILATALLMLLLGRITQQAMRRAAAERASPTTSTAS